MNTRVAKLAQERERLISVIDAQRQQVGWTFASLRRPLHGADRVRHAASYVMSHRTALWLVFTLFSLIRRTRARRKLLRAGRAALTRTKGRLR